MEEKKLTIGTIVKTHTSEWLCDGNIGIIEQISKDPSDNERDYLVKLANRDLEYWLKESELEVYEIELKKADCDNCPKATQAVKDTAKEILDEVSKHYGGAWLVELYNRYGVEV